LAGATETTSDIKTLWSSLLKSAKPTARTLFEQDRRGFASAEVSKTRHQESISGKQHVGMLNAKLKSLWEGLSDGGRQEWEAKALELRQAEEGSNISRYVHVSLLHKQRSYLNPAINLSSPAISHFFLAVSLARYLGVAIRLEMDVSMFFMPIVTRKIFSRPDGACTNVYLGIRTTG